MRHARLRPLSYGVAIASLAGGAPVIAAETDKAPFKFELFDSSRPGCSQKLATGTTTGMECAFDTAARGGRVAATQDFGKASVETYATVAHATVGAFTPDQLLTAPDRRSAEATDFFLVGLKGRAFDERLKFTTEFASSKRVVNDLLQRDWTRDDRSSDSGTSALVRLQAVLASSPRFNWSLTAEMRSVSDGYGVGRAGILSRYAAMPGTRWALSSRARVGQLGLTAGLDRLTGPYGDSAASKAGLDVHGVSLRVVSRDASFRPLEGSSLVGSRTRSTSTYLDLDTNMLAMNLSPHLGDLPFLVPSMVSISFRSRETESRYSGSSQRFERSSLGVDGTWETPIGETMLSYWRDSRTALGDPGSALANETVQASHLVRRGNWRFGLDASLTRTGGANGSGFAERSWSFGQTVAYSRPDGPEFRLALGQDRSVMRLRDDSFASVDNHSRVTASLDLSRYLQKRFERPDLRLTLDYRKAIDRSDSEINLFDELVERWVDGERREGLLMSFGMKL